MDQESLITPAFVRRYHARVEHVRILVPRRCLVVAYGQEDGEVRRQLGQRLPTARRSAETPASDSLVDAFQRKDARHDRGVDQVRESCEPFNGWRAS